ncbi:MAG: metallophosphoesterase [Pelobium sp.]
MKDHFIIGDVHGCYHTLQEILKHWKAKEQTLIFVGDIIDHGNFSPQTAAFIKDIQKKHPDTAVLRGNHEQLFIQHCLNKFNEEWYVKSGERTFAQYLKENREVQADADWFASFALHYETPTLLISHAGVSNTDDPYNAENEAGVVWHRDKIKKLPQLQVYGHTPQDEAVFDPETNSIDIDTGAYKGNKLTALIVKNDGAILDMLDEHTHKEDIPKEEEEPIL